MQRTWSKGLEIAFEDTGGGDRAIVLIHGAFGDHSDYDPLIRLLAQRNRVVSLDLRGHGQSSVPETGYRLSDFADDVLAVCREAGVRSAVLVGHSMAGIVALIAADVEPDLVAGVVLLDGAFLFPEPMRRQVLDTLVPELEGPHWADAIRSYFANSLMFGPFDPPELRSRILDRLSETPPQIPAELWRDIFESDWATEIVAARCPLLYIHATIPVPLDRFKELRPDALVGSVIGGGHYMALVVPEQVSAMIDRFLDVLPMTAAAYA